MNWKNRLTKTPYLLLFIVLISVGVGTASALITITLSGDVVITGLLDMTGDKITNVGTPTVSTDTATKGYVDADIAVVESSIESITSEIRCFDFLENLDFHDCDISGVDFSGFTLTNADLTNADLTNTDVTGAFADPACFGNPICNTLPIS
jgi:hypothetical protein